MGERWGVRAEGLPLYLGPHMRWARDPEGVVARLAAWFNDRLLPPNTKVTRMLQSGRLGCWFCPWP